MPLKEEFEKCGNWLFRWRSYLPFILIGIILPAMGQYNYFGNSHFWNRIWEVICLSISFMGLAIRIYTIGHAPAATSGRNIRKQKAAVLNTTGMYSIMRHPLYLGNFFIWMGISMFVHLWWVSALFILVFWIYYERIMFAEEEFLHETFGEIFEAWASRTPAFFPRFKNWQHPESPFSLRKVLRKEYSGFFAIIASFTGLEIIGDLVVEGKLNLDLMWIILFSIGLITYMTLRTLKKASII